MNVKELRKELKKFPKNHEVMIHDTDYGLCGDITVDFGSYRPIYPLSADPKEVVVIR